MSIKTILLIVWIICAGFLVFSNNMNISLGNSKETVIHPICTLIALPVIGIVLIYLGKVLAYPLTYFFNK